MENGKIWTTVVPCKNCRFSSEIPGQNSENFLLCNLRESTVRPEGYCSDGKLRDDKDKKK